MEVQIKMTKGEKVKEAVVSYRIKEPNKVHRKEPNKVCWARLRAGITTQTQLAHLTGIHPTIINELERGKRMINPQWAVKIAKVTGVNWQDLMS
jgi:DNA-binding XRE family transcriptional regulator